MAHLIVSSIGTSLITNAMPDADRKKFFALSNKTGEDLTSTEKQSVDEAIERAKTALEGADVSAVKRLSAELNGVLSLMQEQTSVTRNVHLLIGTDTYAGRATCGLVGTWLTARGDSVYPYIPDGLRTIDLGEFRAALADLVHELLPTLDGYRANGYEITFNLTGGFKGVPGFLQALATVTGAEAVYVFEGSPALMRIPRLPIELNADAVVGQHIGLFRKLAAKVAQPMADLRRAGVPETLLLIDGEQALLSEWGAVVWERAWPSLASKGLLPSRSDKLRHSEKFERDVGAIRTPSRHLLDVNTALERFTRVLDGNEGALAKGRLQKLQNPNAYPGSTHELYAWHDGAAGRMFLHDANGVWIVDALDGHL